MREVDSVPRDSEGRPQIDYPEVAFLRRHFVKMMVIPVSAGALSSLSCFMVPEAIPVMVGVAVAASGAPVILFTIAIVKIKEMSHRLLALEKATGIVVHEE